MKSRCNKAFSLIEALIATAILSTAVIFLFRSFATVLSAMRLSQNITLAGYLAEGKLWEIEEMYKYGENLPTPGTDTLQNTDFKWSYEISDADIQDLKKLNLTLSWRESLRLGEYSMNFLTYLEQRE